jgi:hypothetical protein
LRSRYRSPFVLFTADRTAAGDINSANKNLSDQNSLQRRYTDRDSRIRWRHQRRLQISVLVLEQTGDQSRPGTFVVVHLAEEDPSPLSTTVITNTVSRSLTKMWKRRTWKLRNQIFESNMENVST